MMKKVFIGLSGGVDSAVSAALLIEQGFDVTGVFIKVWQPDFLPCSWREERRDAMRVAIALDIPFLFFDFEKEYKKGVVDKMLEEYKVGRTPNPDILCNREIKFGAFWQKAKSLGADFIATGHYARMDGKNKEVVSSAHGQGGKFATDTTSLFLKEGKDKEKDQSYFLWTLTQADLAHTLFPIGDLEKSEVRVLARKYDLPVSTKKDSQGICFIGDVSIDEFLSYFIKTKPGKVLNLHGETIGVHKGALFFTIGERHGFEISRKYPDEGPYYVVSKDMKMNTITVSNRRLEIIANSPSKISVKDMNWIAKPDFSSLSARIRYRGEKIPVNVSDVKSRAFDKWEVEFPRSVRGLSLGQSIVFYQDDVCLGGGVMDEVL